MFSAIARRYDLANHVLSCGFDFYWRRCAANTIAGWHPNKLLDLATGTGDLALNLQHRLPAAEVTGADFSEEMLAIARAKGLTRTILADIIALPFVDQSFDSISIGFGLRNVSDWHRGVSEMHRVLRREGHLLILDFSLPTCPGIRAAYRTYLHRFIPTIAAFLTKQRSAYEYLGDSIEDFPSGDSMLRLLESNGFVSARAEPLTFGIVTIYTATKL